MGVYIKGMEMPKSCGHCFINHICKRIPTQKAMFVTKRLNGCPLIEVLEPHGRLVDMKVIEDEINELILLGTNYKQMARFILNETPTVIEAEGE